MRALYRLLIAVVAASVAVLADCRGSASDRARTLRAALDALIVGLRAIPSIAWFPLVILLFQFSESAILFRDAVRRQFIGGRRQVKR